MLENVSSQYPFKKVSLAPSPAETIPAGRQEEIRALSSSCAASALFTPRQSFVTARPEDLPCGQVFRTLLFTAVPPSEATGDVPHEQEHYQDHQQQPQDTAGAVAPTSAVAPSWQTAHEQYDENNQQDQAHW